jgi:hypothetical protein
VIARGIDQPINKLRREKPLACSFCDYQRFDRRRFCLHSTRDLRGAFARLKATLLSTFDETTKVLQKRSYFITRAMPQE